MAKAQAKLGKKIILLWRLLEKAGETKAAMTFYQTSHSTEGSRDSDKTATKMGAVQTSASFEEQVPFSFLLANDDPTIEILEESNRLDKVVELWETDMNVKEEQGYPTEYRQGTISELNVTKNTEEAVTVEGTFLTNLLPQKGYVQLSEELEKAAQYKFRDLDPYTEPEEEGGGEEEPGV